MSASIDAALAPAFAFEVFAVFAAFAGLVELLLFAAGEHPATSDAAINIANDKNLLISFSSQKEKMLGLSNTIRCRIRLAAGVLVRLGVTYRKTSELYARSGQAVKLVTEQIRPYDPVPSRSMLLNSVSISPRTDHGTCKISRARPFVILEGMFVKSI
jgi:hypothetical protein